MDVYVNGRIHYAIQYLELKALHRLLNIANIHLVSYQCLVSDYSTKQMTMIATPHLKILMDNRDAILATIKNEEDRMSRCKSSGSYRR